MTARSLTEKRKSLRRIAELNSLTVALRWIHEHLTEPLDIEELCRESFMSRSRLYAEFKLRLDCSPMELQQQIRIKEAGKRLQRGEVITNICYDLGFSSPSHFCRRFKNMYGCTPTEYKTGNQSAVTALGTNSGSP